MPLPPRWRWKLDRWRESLAGPARSEEQQQSARPRLCPACGKLVGAKAAKCHECGASMTFSLAAASRSLSGLMPGESPITYVILGINLFLFGVAWVASMQQGGGTGIWGGDGQVLYRLGARFTPAIFQGELWRLVMAMFLHSGFLHIGFNSWILMDIGPQVEEVYGSARYLFLYVFTGVASFVASTAWDLVGTPRFGTSVGASGALMGLIGLMLAITQRRGGAYMRMLRASLIRWVLYIAALGLLLPGIDNAAHFGGLAAGYLLGRVVEDRPPQGPSERKRAYLLGWLAALVVIASFAAMLLQYFRPGVTS